MNERRKLSWLSNIDYLKQAGFPKKENFCNSVSFFRIRFHQFQISQDPNNRVARRTALFRIKLAVLRGRIESWRADYLYPDPFFHRSDGNYARL